MAEKTLSIKILLNDKQFMSGMRKTSTFLKKLGGNMQKTGKNLSRNLTLPILAFGAASVKAFDKQQKALAQVESGLRSTGNAAGFTSEQLQKMAADLQGKTIFGDEVILKDATAQLLTFTNISGEQFARTQVAALDLATRLDGDLKSASIQLGKALNDPVANLSALSRSGIQFSEEQKATIKSLAETNRLADAQTLILDELNKQYGGSAEAAAQAGIGGIQQLQNSLGDLGEEFGKIISDNIGPFVEKVKGLVGFLRGLTDEQKKTIVQVAGFAAALGPAIFLLGKITTAVGGLIKIIRVLTAVAMTNPFVLLTTAATALVGVMGFAILDTEKFIKTALQMGKVGKFIAKVVLGALSAISPKYQAYFSIIDKVGESLDEQEGKLKDSTKEIDANKNAVDKLNTSLQNLNNTQQKGRDGGIPTRIEPKKTGLVATDTSIPETLEGVADIKPTGLKTFSEAFFDFSEDFKSTIQNTFAEISGLMSGVSNLFSQLHNKRMTELENEKAAELAKIENTIVGEEAKELAINKVNEKFDKKKAELDKKQAIRSKKIAVLEAIVNTAAAVVQALPNIPLSIAIGALGAAQVATIASTPIPTFSEGGIVSGPTVGLMGEYAGANTNPEVIAPLNKLKDMIGGQTIQVQGMISGEDIFLSNDRYSRRKNSY